MSAKQYRGLVPDKIINDVAKKYATSDITMLELAAEYSCSESTIRKYLLKAGVKMRRIGPRYKLSKADHIKLRKLRAEGATVPQLAREFKLAETTVIAYCRYDPEIRKA